MLKRWLQRHRAKQAAADVAVRRAGQVQAAVDLAISEGTKLRPVASLADIDYQPQVDPFDVVRLADELFGLQLQYTEARELLIERMRFRGYLSWPYDRPDWLTDEDPTAGPGPGFPGSGTGAGDISG